MARRRQLLLRELGACHVAGTPDHARIEAGRVEQRGLGAENLSAHASLVKIMCDTPSVLGIGRAAAAKGKIRDLARQFVNPGTLRCSPLGCGGMTTIPRYRAERPMD